MPPTAPAGVLPAYAELHCRSNFSFLTGASHPEELVGRAHALGYAALAITDEGSHAGVVRAHAEARRCGLHLIVGAEMRLAAPGPPGAGDHLQDYRHAIYGGVNSLPCERTSWLLLQFAPTLVL